MSRRSAAGTWPVYRIMLKSEWGPTCVVAGAHRRSAWLYVHGRTPTVLRLHPPVVGFLRDVLSELAARPAPGEPAELVPVYRTLRRDTVMSYPACVVAGRSRGDAWLYVHAATPSAVRLTAPLVDFLLGALDDLPSAGQTVTAAPLAFARGGDAER